MKGQNCGNCKEDSCVFQGDWGNGKSCQFWTNSSKQTSEGKP